MTRLLARLFHRHTWRPAGTPGGTYRWEECATCLSHRRPHHHDKGIHR